MKKINFKISGMGCVYCVKGIEATLNNQDGILKVEISFAIESADIVLMKSDLLDAALAIKLSDKTIRNIKQNLFLSFAYNFAGIPIAAGLLFPFFGILLSPIIAAVAMSLSSISVLLNALRLKRIKKEFYFQNL